MTLVVCSRLADGVVSVASSQALDYEAAPSYSIEVKATSTDGSSSYKTFTIDVGNESDGFLDANSRCWFGKSLAVYGVAASTQLMIYAPTMLTTAVRGCQSCGWFVASCSGAGAECRPGRQRLQLAGRFNDPTYNGNLIPRSGYYANKLDGEFFNHLPMELVIDEDASLNEVSEVTNDGELVGIEAFTKLTGVADAVITYELSNDADGRLQLMAKQAL